MRRKFYFYMLIGFTFASLTVHGQNWAGPDKALCGSTEGATIGLENAPSEYCYSWSPLAGIQGSPHEAQIVVKPQNPTTYSVTVTGSNFSFRQVDDVEVEVDFGGVEFNPSYANPDGESNQSNAIVTNNPGNHPFTWSIVEPAGPTRLGCSVDPNTGVISGCNNDGEITIRATRDDFPQCQAENTFRVNLGVKDVIATDINTGNGVRKAKAGQTLYLIGRNGAQFEAIPNDGESFGPNDIMWSGSPDAPTSGVTTWISDQGAPTSITISANDKQVNVIRKPVLELSLGNPVSQLAALLRSGLLKFKPVKNYTEFNEEGSCLPPFDAPEPSFAFNYKMENTNKFNSPEEGTKYTIEGIASIGATGRVCFPPPYSSPPNPFGFYYTYVFLSGTVKVNASGSKDEGAATMPGWEWNNLVGEGEIKAGLGADFGTSLPGDFITVYGSISGSTAITLTAQWKKPTIEAKVKFEPLIVEGSFKVWVNNPNEPIVGPVAGKYNVVDPYESQFTPIFTFE